MKQVIFFVLLYFKEKKYREYEVALRGPFKYDVTGVEGREGTRN